MIQKLVYIAGFVGIVSAALVAYFLEHISLGIVIFSSTLTAIFFLVMVRRRKKLMARLGQQDLGTRDR